MRSPHKKLLLAIVLTLTFLTTWFAQGLSGPSRGTLIVTGGAFGPGVIERFVSLAGGPDANFVYIPTAASSLRLDSGFIYEPPDSDTPATNTRQFEEELARMFGVKHVTILHTRNRQTANSRAFVQILTKVASQGCKANPGLDLANAFSVIQRRASLAMLEPSLTVGLLPRFAGSQVRGHPYK